jgi:glycerol-3-phosphate O-acyltransferase
VRGLVRSIDVVVGRYGRLSVQFGKPMTLADVLREIDPKATADSVSTMTPAKRRAVITRLAYRVMNEINAVTAVTPGSLVATALLAHDRRGLPHADMVARCERLARTLRRAGARFSPSLADADGRLRASALREAVDLFVRAGHVEAHVIRTPERSEGAEAMPMPRTPERSEGAEAMPMPRTPERSESADAMRTRGDEVIYVVPPDARMSLDLAKNVLIHFFAPRALIATALMAGATTPAAPVGADTVRERVLALSRLFKYEFTFRADAPFETIFDDEVAAMQDDGELARVVRKPSEGAGALVAKGDDGREQIELYARLLENFIEGYRVAARGLGALLRGPLSMKDLTKRAIATGERMFLAGEIARREAVSRPLLENAYTSFVDQGYLSRSGGRLGLTPSYATQSAVATIEARIAAMGATLSG